MNRPRNGAVYRTPKDAWGLPVWREELPEEIVARSVERYDSFYRDLEAFTADCLTRFSRLVILDLHSYNHRRAGQDDPGADVAGNPEVNLGTGSMDRKLWAPVVDAFLKGMSAAEVQGHRLDVRENVRFKGGYLSRWVHENFPESGCVLAIELKKTFMDEWSGEINREHVAELKAPPPLAEFILTPEEKLAREKAPIDIDSDYFELVDNEVTNFTGSAEMVKADQKLWGDYITRNLKTNFFLGPQKIS